MNFRYLTIPSKSSENSTSKNIIKYSDYTIVHGVWSLTEIQC